LFGIGRVNYGHFNAFFTFQNDDSMFALWTSEIRLMLRDIF